MRIIKIIVPLIIFLSSCKSEDSSMDRGDTSIAQKDSPLEKLDSIKIHFLGVPTVHDIDPSSKTVVFMEHRETSEDIYIADFDGTIRSSFSKFGDLPDTYGGILSTIRIVDSTSFLVYGKFGFFTYNFEGKVQSLVKHPNTDAPSHSMTAMGYGMEKLEERYLYINQEQLAEDHYLTHDINLLVWLDPENGETEPLISFPEGSIFRNGNHFIRGSWFPVYFLDEEHIYVCYGTEPVIYRYESKKPYELLSQIPLVLTSYNSFKGLDHQDFSRLFGMFMTKGKLLNIKKIGDYFLVAYFPGYDALDTETNFENKTPEESKVFRERMQQKYPDRIALVDSLGNVIHDVVPDGLEPRSMLFRDGQLWMMEKRDEEVERDYFRLFRVGLKVD